METTRLGASVTNSHGNATTTPLGPEVSLEPVNPLNPPGICLTNTPLLASTTSMTALDRSAR